MRILFNLQNFEKKEIDGVGYYVKRLIGLLSDADEYEIFIYYPKNFDVSVLDLHKKIKLISGSVYKIKIFKLAHKFFLLPLILRRFKFDFVFYPSPPVGIISAGAKTITTVHDLTPLIIDRKQGGIYKIYYYLIVLVAICKSDKIISISENTKTDLIKYYPFVANKIKVIYNFLTNEKSDGVDDKFFLMVSTLQPGKNIERAILAFNKFSRVRSDYKLVIVGRDGWGADSIYKLIHDLSLDKKVMIKGYVSEKKLDELYSRCTAVVHISLYEGFGYAPLEGMYRGKPSIVSNCSSLPEVVGPSGLLVNPLNVDEIAESMLLMTDQVLRANLIRHIDEYIAKFDPYTQIRLFKDLLISLK